MKIRENETRRGNPIPQRFRAESQQVFFEKKKVPTVSDSIYATRFLMYDLFHLLFAFLLLSVWSC